MKFKSFTWILFNILLVVADQNISEIISPPATINFSCKGRDTGFYADIAADCKVYHTCDDHGNKFTHRCPEETAFRQETLVCDHAYLVDCKTSARLISQVSEDTTNNFTNLRNNRADPFKSYSRSFRISAQPAVLLLTPNEKNKEPTTFFMSSTVFLRDQSNSRKTEILSQSPKAQNSENQRASLKSHSTTLTTTLRPQLFNQKLKESTSNLPSIAKTKNRFSENSNLSDFRNTQQKFVNLKPNSPYNGNYPYFETLRSIQNKTRKAYWSTTPRTTTAGTEFPIPTLVGMLSGSNSLQEDPYYPRHSTSTEMYYTLSTKNKLHQPFTSYNRKPWLNTVGLKIPDVLPDFNSLEDIVDRRKHLYIPKSKNN